MVECSSSLAAVRRLPFLERWVPVMDNEEFVQRIKDKIERLTQRTVELVIDEDNPEQLSVDLAREVPQVVLGSNVYEYAGFARMCIEYAVESIKQRRPIDALEFHLLLARN
jgi:hypothetical protein